MTTHLITAVTSQDGIWLARLLTSLGHTVVGTVLPDTNERLVYLEGTHAERLDVRDSSTFAALVGKVRPDVVHNLAALTSVGDSWDGPDDVREVNQHAVERMLDVLLDLPWPAPRFVQASSGEIFGGASSQTLADPDSPLRPVSPYGEAKAGAHRAVVAARDAGLRGTNLILFGHTSFLQATRFAVPLVAQQAAEVGLGKREAVTLRDPTACRDWGSARDYVRAFAAATRTAPGDYVVATGSLHTLGEIAGWALTAAGAPEAEVRSSGAPPRPHDVGSEHADIERTRSTLGWAPEVSLREEVERTVRVAQQRLASGVEHDPAYLAGD